MSRLMTNLEHSEFLKGALLAAPRISVELADANALAASKELYELGEITKEDYTELLTIVLNRNGFKVSNKTL